MESLFFDASARWFTVAAFIGTLVFILKMGMLLIGAAADGASDLEFDGGVDGGLDAMDGVDVNDVSDSTSDFKALSIQGGAAFLMGFGWGGLGAIKGLGYDLTVGIVAGLACGAAMVWLLSWMLRKVYILQGSGTVRIQDAIGRDGQVYVTVPAAGAGRGQVSLVIGDRQRTFSAVTTGDELPRHARVRVVRVNTDHTVTVEPA